MIVQEGSRGGGDPGPTTAPVVTSSRTAASLPVSLAPPLGPLGGV